MSRYLQNRINMHGDEEIRIYMWGMWGESLNEDRESKRVSSCAKDASKYAIIGNHGCLPREPNPPEKSYEW